MYHNHDKTENDGEVNLRLGLVLHPDTDVCAGGVSIMLKVLYYSYLFFNIFCFLGFGSYSDNL